MLLLFAAIGPEVGYPFNVGKHQWYANMRDYYESWVQDRVQGHEQVITLGMKEDVARCPLAAR